uniref:DUF4378 domain-containing protein n=1 Tax=Bursaphelenchus xylophilus TaxID=6326 RepID=A0A1I7SK49_BURXY
MSPSNLTNNFQVYLWARNAIRDLLHTLDIELNPQYPPKDQEAETTRLETIDNILVATHSLMNCPINRNDDANSIIRAEDESLHRKNVARYLFAENEERFWNLVKELAKRCEMAAQNVEWRNEDIEIQRHIIIVSFDIDFLEEI